MTAEIPAIKTRNATTTRLAILDAARACFFDEGYDHVGLRAIAAGAQVDAALICRYFGSKEKLFAEVLATSAKDPMNILAGERGTFGRRVAQALLAGEDCSPERTAFIQLLTRSSASPVASKLVRAHIERQFIKPFTTWLGDECAAEKAWLIGAILMGITTMVGFGTRAPGGPETIDRVARTLQHIVDSPCA